MTGIATPPSGGGRRAQCTEAAAPVGAFSTQLCAAVAACGHTRTTVRLRAEQD